MYKTNIKYNPGITKDANEFAKNVSTKWRFKPDECHYAQMAKGIFQQKDDHFFQCQTVSPLVKFFFDPKNNYSRPAYTCYGSETYLKRGFMGNFTDFGLGTWVAPGTSDHDKGKKVGVRAWFTVFWKVPDSLIPTTQTPPTNPDVTITTTSLTTTTKKSD